MTALDSARHMGDDKVRDGVAGVCETLGVPWYGPTFDS